MRNEQIYDPVIGIPAMSVLGKFQRQRQISRNDSIVYHYIIVM